MTIYHKHHIIPRHMGGTDDPSNLIELTVEEHAEAHRKLFEQYGRWQDKIAWKALSGQISKEEARIASARSRNTDYMRTDDYRKKISNANKGKIPWNKGKKAAQDFSKISSKNHYRSSSCKFKGKTYHSIKEAVEDTGLSKYFLEKSPHFSRI